MLFALICTDNPGQLQKRADTRPAHVDWLNALGANFKAAGPFLGEDGRPNGSLVVIAAENLEAAKSLAAKDPYALAGLFASVDIRPWNWVLKNPENA